MHRFSCEAKDISGGGIILKEAGGLHHLKNVLRLKPGSKAEACDEKGNLYFCCLESLSRQEAFFRIERHIKQAPHKGVSLTVACAIPKKAKMDEIIDKLTQLGVERIVPMRSERVIVKIGKDKEAERLARWRKVADSAFRQSKRRALPQVEPVQDFREVVTAAGEYDLKLIPYLEGRRRKLHEVLRGGGFSRVILLIGPEGDFSPAEAGLAREKGFIPVTLGETVLRVDTAAVAAASFIKLYEND